MKNSNENQEKTGRVTGIAVGEEEVIAAVSTLARYKASKSSLDERVLDNERWFRLRHWDSLKGKNGKKRRNSAWLFNSIINKHADFMDSIPQCTVLPREESDTAEAERLTSIIPVVLERNNWQQIYSDAAYRKLKTGTAVYAVLWDPEASMGEGEIVVKNADILNLFWEPGITDIQKSRNLFYVDIEDNDLLIEQYPFLEGQLGGVQSDIMSYVYDESIDTSKKSVVVDWYYKKRIGRRTVVHYCKLTGSHLLYSSENDPKFSDSGWYDHGMYPFILDPLFREEGTPAGFGYIDIMKDTQEEIDILGNEIIKNARLASRKRFFTRIEGSVNEEEFADFDRDFVHVAGSSIGEESIREITVSPLSPVYLNVLNSKILELKETSGNRDFAQGGTMGGVTSGTAISALQEAGNKLSRDMISATYNAFSGVCLMIIELMRQFYTLPRSMRTVTADGEYLYHLFDNSEISGRQLEGDFGSEGVLRKPLFDVSIKAHKLNAFSRQAQNADALNFYSLGFFNPEKATESLACMELLDMENKEKIKRIIRDNQKLTVQSVREREML